MSLRHRLKELAKAKGDRYCLVNSYSHLYTIDLDNYRGEILLNILEGGGYCKHPFG